MPATDPVPATVTMADRAIGALYGVALGDAMGMPGELWPRRRIIEHFGRIEGFLPGPDGHFIVDGFVAGQVTDDTQQTVMLSEAILDGGGVVDGTVVARHLVAWADRVGATGGTFLGPSSERAIGLLRQGRPLEEAGARGDTNGAAMRVVPVGVLMPSDDPEALAAAVVESCRPSHFTDVAIRGAAMIAAAVSRAIDGGSPQEAIDCARTVGAIAAASGNPTPSASLDRRLDMALEIVSAGGGVGDGADDERGDEAVLQELYDVLGAGVATSEAVPTALALALRGGGDPMRTALLCANLGGDTDTIGAMATGIAGALSGIAAIPRTHLDRLDAVNDLGGLGPMARALVDHRASHASHALNRHDRDRNDMIDQSRKDQR